MASAGFACLTAGVLIGLTAHRRGTWLDQAMPSAAERVVSRQNVLVQTLSSEAYWPHGAYVTALLPVAATVVVLAGEVRQHGVLPVLDRWRWVLLTLVAVPVHYALRVAFGRPGPGEASDEATLVGAYPSGSALAVGLGWVLCVVVVGELRPRCRPWLVVFTVVVLIMHAVVRVVTHKHWATDIIGSYLLVASAFLLAGAVRPDSSRQCPSATAYGGASGC